MIISHKYKFIFLKTRKTAGTSIEIALSQFLGEKDIITPISSEDEMIRNKLGYRTSQNYYIKFANYTARDWARLLIKRKKGQYFNHMTCRQIKSRIGNEIWSNYFKFCFERNPWDKAISFYYYSNRNKNLKISLLDYLKNVKIHNISNFEIYADKDNEIVVDRVCLYENLDQEMEFILNHLGLPNFLTLPNAKGSFRKDRRNYREIISTEERKLIEKLCFREISHFGYEF